MGLVVEVSSQRFIQTFSITISLTLIPKTTESFEVLTLRGVGANIDEIVGGGGRTDGTVENSSKALAINHTPYANVKTTRSSQVSTPRVI